MPSAAEYRHQAARCIEVAERLRDAVESARMHLMAQAFFDLADRLEERANKTSRESHSR
jgi:hypothetical protein